MRLGGRRAAVAIDIAVRRRDGAAFPLALSVEVTGCAGARWAGLLRRVYGANSRLKGRARVPTHACSVAPSMRCAVIRDRAWRGWNDIGDEVRREVLLSEGQPA